MYPHNFTVITSARWYNCRVFYVNIQKYNCHFTVNTSDGIMVISQSLRVVSGITADYSMLTFEVILVISQSSRGVGDKRDECSMLKTARIAHIPNINNIRIHLYV